MPPVVDGDVLAGQPAKCSKPSRRAAACRWPSRSLSARPISTPMRRILSGCCARTAIGHAAAVPAEQRDELAAWREQPVAQHDKLSRSVGRLMPKPYDPIGSITLAL
jgi:hypothetical protein